MVDVAVVGAGQTKYGNHALGLKGMWAEAAAKAFASIDGDFTPSIIDEAFIGSIAFGGSTRKHGRPDRPLPWTASRFAGLRMRVPPLDLPSEMRGWPSKAVRPMLWLLVALRK